MSAGYKQQCIDDGAEAFWSFDSDAFDRTDYTPLGDIILDDASGETPGRIIHEYPQLNHLWIGNTSLVEMEQSQNHCALFARNDGPFAIPAQFPRSMVSVDHTAHLDFSTNNGSFSVEFIMRKSYDHGFETLKNNGNGIYWYHNSPIIRKKGVFSFYAYQQNTYVDTTCRLEFRGPIGNCYCYVGTIDWRDNTTHIILTYDLAELQGNEWLATQTLWVNGRSIQTITQTFFDSSFSANNTTSQVEIGGFTDVLPVSGEPGNSMSDRNTSTLYMDQISMYKHALTSLEIASHFKKAWTYTTMVKMQGPQNYWDFQAPVATSESGYKSMLPVVGAHAARIYGINTPAVAGPPTVFGSVGLELSSSSCIHIYAVSSWYGVPMVPNVKALNDYTFEMFFKCESSRPGTLMSLTPMSATMHGMELEINRNLLGGVESGTITYCESSTTRMQAAGGFSDGNWHHVAVRRIGERVELWVDGEFWDGATANWAGIGGGQTYGQLMLFGGIASNRFAGPGAIAHAALYNYGHASAQIQTRSLFTLKYEIKGVVTLQGNPFEGTIRFYNHRTGEFIAETRSNLVTGEYQQSFASATDVDVICMDKYNPNVRYRAFGPVSPASLEDYPITL